VVLPEKNQALLIDGSVEQADVLLSGVSAVDRKTPA